MKRKHRIILLPICAILLNSCRLKEGGGMIFNDGDRRADMRMERLLNTIKSKDRGALKAMFSRQALDEADNFDAKIEDLFRFLQGDIKSWKQDRFGSNISVENGKKSEMLLTWYTIITDNDEYRLFIIDYAQDTINPNNTGLYALRIIKATDTETQFTSWQTMKTAGIYVPQIYIQ
jgi:hypothetical protein